MKQLLTSFIAGIYLLSLNPMIGYAQPKSVTSIISQTENTFNENKESLPVSDSVPITEAESKDSVSNEEKASVLINAKSGGKVTLGGASVEIPAGALEKDTEISITRLSSVAETGEGLENVTVGGGGYRFLPAGTKFKIDAVISLPYDISVQDGALEDTCTYFYDTDIKEWVALERIEIDRANNTIISRTSHFTDMINGAPSMPESPSPADVSLNSIKNLEAANPSGIVLPLKGLEPSSTGEASFSFELEIPSGVHGMQPHVTLSYSSGNGSGNAGRGFSVNAGSAITTDTRHGLPAYDGKSDTYMKDGILLARETDGTDAVLDTYKPLREITYETIKANRLDPSNGHFEILSWAVTAKDGTVSTYGNIDKSYSYPDGEENKRYAWYVTSETDAHGNTINYTYEENEKNIYISEISYSGNKIEFYYEDRQDVRVDARGRFVQKSAWRIKSISTFYGDKPLKTYYFNYEYGLASQSLLTDFFCKSTGAEEDDWKYTFEYEDIKKDSNGRGIVFGEIKEIKNGKPINVQNSSSSGSNVSASAGVGVGGKSLAAIITGGYQGSSSKGNSYADYMLIDIDGDGVNDCVTQTGSNQLTIYKGNPTECSEEKYKGSFGDPIVISNLPLSYKIGKESTKNSTSGYTLYGGIAAARNTINAGVTYSSINQDGESKVYSMFSDIDGDGLVDIIEIGKDTYLKNTSKESSISFEERKLQNNIKGIYHEYTDTEKEAYNASFYVQTPFRAWRAPYSGTVSLSQTAAWGSKNKSSAFTDTRIFYGDTCINRHRLSSADAEYTDSTEIYVEKGEYIYFISSHNNDENLGHAYDLDLRESDIEWNVSIKYESVRPFLTKWRNLFLASPDISVCLEADSEDELLHLYKDYPEIDDLYTPSEIGTCDEESSHSFQRTWNLKSEWREIVRKGNKYASFFIDRFLFIPEMFTRTKFEDLIQILSNCDTSISVMLSYYAYDTESDTFHIAENTKKESEYNEKMQAIWKNLKDGDVDVKRIFQEAVTEIQIMNCDGKWLSDTSIEYSTNEECTFDTQRLSGKYGSVYENSGNIFLGKYEGKEAYTKQTDSETLLYIDGKLSDKNTKINYDSDSVTVTIEEKDGDGNKTADMIYLYSNFTKIASRIEKSELQELRDYENYSIGSGKDKITEAYWDLISVEDVSCDSLYRNYMSEEEKELFISCFDETYMTASDGTTKIPAYKRKSTLSSDLIASVNKILSAYSLHCYWESNFSSLYTEEDGYYLLKDECSDFLENEVVDSDSMTVIQKQAAKIQNLCKEKKLGKYTTLKTSIVFEPSASFKVSEAGDSFERLSIISDNGLHFSYTTETSDLSWNTADDFSVKNNQGEQTFCDNAFTTDSVLYGGIKNWYYGIWSGAWNENRFSETQLLSAYSESDFESPEQEDLENWCATEGKKNEKSVSESVTKNNGSSESLLPANIFTLPVEYTEDDYNGFLSSDYEQKEEETEENLLYSELSTHILGNISVNAVNVEQWTDDGELEQTVENKYYVPFINQKGIIHANRYGGKSFYDILFEEQEGFDALRKMETEGTVKKLEASVNTPLSGVISLADTADAVVGILTGEGFGLNLSNFSKYTKNLSGDASAKMTQNLIDLNGDSVPDIVQTNGSSADVYYGSVEKDGSVTYTSSKTSHIDNLGYMGGSKLNDEEIYNGSFSPLGAVTRCFTSKGRFAGEVLNGVISSPAISASTSKNEQKYGLLDINGDGLPDYFNESSIALNVGKSSFVSGATSHFLGDLGKGENLSIGATLSIPCATFDIAKGQIENSVQSTLSITDTSSASISNVAYSDINGDGLVDKIVKEIDEKEAKVYYNNGSSFEDNYSLIEFNEWDVSDYIAQYVKCSDGNLFKDSWIENISLLKSETLSDFVYLNPFGASESIMKRYTNMLDFSNTISLSLNGAIGANVDIKIPVFFLFIHINGKSNLGINTTYSLTGVTSQLSDINGDGVPDRLLRIPGGTVGTSEYNEYTFVQLNELGKVGLLKAVNLPQGGRYEIAYEFVAGSTLAGSGRYAMSQVTKIENPKITDDSYSVPYKAANGTEGNEENTNRYTTTFTYQGGYYDRAIKEFFGYGKVIATQGVGKEAVTTTTEYYNTDYYSKGMTKSVSISDSDDTIYSLQEFEVDEAPYARITKKTEISYEQNEQTNGISVITEYTYGDEWGNVTSLLETTSDDTKDIYAELEYAEGSDVLNHGLITELRAYEGNSSSGTLMRRRSATYNKAGDMMSLSTYYDENSCSTYCFDYEPNGNINYVCDPNGMTSAFTYYDDPRFVQTVSVSGNGCDTYTSKFVWEFERELKLKETDPNGNSMRYEYDTLGRLKEVWTPEDTDSPAVSYEYHKSDDGVWYSVTRNKTLYDRSASYENPVIETVAVSDGLGRVKWTAKTGLITDGGTGTKGGWNVSGLVTYDSLARTKAAGMVQFSEASTIDSLLNYEKILVNPSYTYYDAKGRTVKSVLPVDSDGNAPESTTEYLIADGELKTVATDPLKNITVQVSDARGNITYLEKQDLTANELTSVTYSYDVIGQLFEAYNEEPTKPIRVTYDLAGRMTTLASTDSGEKHFFYDEAGNKVREDDSLLRSKGEQIKYEYDGMNRLVRVDYPESIDTVYEYGGANAGDNGAGKIIKTTDSTGTIEYKYGTLGEVVEETRSIYQMSANDGDGTSITATMKYVSDYLGRMQEITYPDGEVVTYGYDEGGQVNKVSGIRGNYQFDYVDSITYDEYGQRAYIKYANGAETHYTYDKARRWLSEIKTESRYRTIQNTKYKFDFVGNVLGTSDNCDLWRTTQSYEYDSLYQLISATGTTYYTANGITDYANSTYKQNFSFDKTGNMLTKISSVSNSNAFTTKNKNSLNYNLTYTYSPDFAHRLSNVNGRYYDYDLNGNLTIEQDAPIGSLGDTSVLTPIVSESLGNDVYKEDYGWAISNPDKKNSAVSSSVYQRTFLWDERNMMTQSSDSQHTVKYRYGADGQRTNKYSIASDKGESVYFNKLWTWRKDSYTPSSGNYCKNIFLDKTRIVTKIRAADETSSADDHRKYFYHGDHLQSATLITDYEGSVYERINYTPYGELWLEKSGNNGENYLPYRFTGKELDSETGLYYYGARYLDPMYSRWLSCDPALGEYIPQAPISDEAKKHNQNLPGMGGVFNPINGNLYHYAGNNPVTYVDPTGCFAIIDDFLFSLIGNALGTRSDGVLGGTWSNFSNSWKMLLHSTVVWCQTIWFAPQELLGLVAGYFFIELLQGEVSFDGGFKYISTYTIGRRGITLGSIGMGHPADKSHEKGHYYQSLILGSLYLFVIGIPSLVHAVYYNHAKNPSPYESFYTEAWAEYYKKKARK